MRLDGVDTFYPLSPLQRGLLFETLLHPSSGAYFNQMIATLRGPTDLDRLRTAWEETAARHAVLRTSFVWEGLKEPVQVVERSVALPWEVEDWRDLAPAQREHRLGALLGAERERGFDLSAAPLMRFTTVRMTEDRVTFIWSFHHLLLDGWSMYLVLEEAFGRYDAHVRGEAYESVQPPPYRDYVSWARRSDMEEAKAYWRGRLEGVSAAQLTVGRGEARGEADQVEDSRAASHLLSEEATLSLTSMCRSRHVTVNTAVLAAWALLLARYTDRDEAVFGSTVSGRSPELPGSQDMVGLLINTLPVRVQVPRDRSVAQWLAELQKEQAELRQYEYTPLFEVQGWCDLPRNVDLFDSVYLFENYRKDGSLEDLGAGMGLADIEWYERTNYPLAVLAVPGDRLFLKAIYHRQRFSAESVEQLLGHWAWLIEEMAGDPDRLVAEISTMPPDEHRRLVVEWNQTSAGIAEEALTHERIALLAEREPERPAVRDAGQRLTFADLDDRADRIARRLAGLGVARGEFVAVCMERSAELITAVLGIMKLGAVYVPLDPATPPDRLRFMVEDCGARVLLGQRRLDHLYPAAGAGPAAVTYVDVEDASAVLPERVEPPLLTSSDLAYMIYTSGSTGRPKGTLIRHGSLLNLVEWHQTAFEVSGRDRAAQVAGPGFDAFGWEIWPYLTCGASVSVVPTEILASPEALRDWLTDQEITITFLPTPLAERVVALDWPGRTTLRTLLTGGDRLRRAPRRGLPFALVNNYGPTESTVVTTSGRVEPSDDAAVPPSIGRPIANTRVYLLDRRGEPVPVGVPGELHIGGAGLAVGYHNRSELTQEKFVPDPFDGTPGARLYRTGDLAMYRPDGTIDFLGRLDFQVKIRGFRVELGEIEGTLVRHPHVSEGVVVAHGAGSEDARLVAYVVASGASPSVSDVREWLRSQLPEYMVPAHYVWMDGLPLTANGKVDRAALPAPTTERPELEAEYVAPATEIERAVARVWSEVLGLERVGKHDSFFDLGGHSLSITEVFGRLRKGVAPKVNLVDLFTYPTVASLASFIEGDASGERPAAQSGLDRAAARKAAMKRRRPSPGSASRAPDEAPNA